MINIVSWHDTVVLSHDTVISRKGVWGTGAIETISEQLRRELPGLRGFGVSNIKNMRQFYESWNVAVNRQPTADALQLTEKETISPL